MKTPEISIVVAVYNGVETLQRCIDSVVSQTYPHVELIIMDGNSIDGTIKVLEANNDIINYWESEADRGITHAWNKALRQATGQWVYFLGADDVLHDRTVLENFVCKIKEVQALPLVAYGKIDFRNGDSHRVIGERWCDLSKKIRTGMCDPHQGMFHNRDLFIKCGPFSERYQIAADYRLLLESLQYTEPLFLGDFVVADMDSGGVSTRRTFRYKVLKEFRYAQKEMGMPCTFSWLWKYFIARCFWLLRID